MLQIRFQLNSSQYRLLKARGKRSFVRHCSESELINKVEQAKDIKTIENIAMQYGLCDYCDFKDLNSEAVNILLKSLIAISYKFPRIRSKICFLGSKAGYLQTLQELCRLNRDIIKRFEIQNICEDSTIINLASQGITMVDNTLYNERENNILAQAFSLCGILDAVVLDEDDFKGFGYMRFCKQLKENSQQGFHPVGCEKPESVIYHEFGHMLDYLCDLSNKKEFIDYYNGFTKEKIANCVSQYATINAQEFFAEAFSEYMCNDHPREVAVYLEKLLEKNYKKII